MTYNIKKKKIRYERCQIYKRKTEKFVPFEKYFIRILEIYTLLLLYL